MLIVMKQSMAGARFTVQPGDVVDTELAGWDPHRLFAKGYAEPYNDPDAKPAADEADNKNKKK